MEREETGIGQDELKENTKVACPAGWDRRLMAKKVAALER